MHDCAEVTLSLFPDVKFHLTPNYPDLVKSDYSTDNTHHHFSFVLSVEFSGESRIFWWTESDQILKIDLSKIGRRAASPPPSGSVTAI